MLVLQYYTNEETGVKFYSKKRVIDFVNSKYACQGTFQSVSELDQKSSYSKSEASPVSLNINWPLRVLFFCVN